MEFCRRFFAANEKINEIWAIQCKVEMKFAIII